MQDKEETKENIAGRPAGPRRYWWVLIVCLAAAGLYVLMTSQAKSSPKKAGFAMPPLPVTATAVQKKDVGVYITGIGSVVPLNTVTVKTVINGQVMQVFYREGQMVKKGDLLVQIDPRPYEVQLTQDEGQLLKDQSLLENARIDLERYRTLWAQNSIPQQQLATQESLVKQYEGAVKTDRGSIASAKLDLVYCRITAPVSGRVGLRLVDPGNIVQTTDTTGLVVITQLQPITVEFPISEDDLPKVLGRLKTVRQPAVEAYSRDDQTKLATGKFLALDNQINSSTGTVNIKAVFPNKGNELFPEQFVNARLFTDNLRGVMVVPEEAIQRGPQGAYVFVVKAGGTVMMRPVAPGITQEGEAVINSGLTPGELVVTEGADRLRDGSKVEVKIQGGAAAQKGRGEQGESGKAV